MKISKQSAIFLSGVLWLVVGMLLSLKGIGYLIRLNSGEGQEFAAAEKIMHYAGSPQWGMLIIIFLSLVVGLCKGCIVLKKTAKRVVERIYAAPSPLSLKSVYPKGYLFLIIGMMCLGLAFKFFPLPVALKGGIDLSVGSALITGATFYFRAATSARATPP